MTRSLWAGLALATQVLGATAQTPPLVVGEAVDATGAPATLLVDPLAPTPVRALLEQAAGSAEPVLTPQLKVDAVARLVSWQGLRWLHRARGGRVVEVDLRSAAVTRERVISSVANACEVLRTHPLAPDGRDAWLAVATGGADANCDTPADNRVVYVRRGAATTTLPLAPEAALAWVADLRDGLGRLQWLLMHDRRNGGALVLLAGASLQAGPAVAGGAPAGRPRLLGDGLGAGTQQVHALMPGPRLVHLSWTDTGATLAEVPYVPQAAEPPAVVDAGGTWMVDGTQLLRLVGAATPVAAATLPAALQTQLAQTPTTVVVLRAGFNGATLLGLPKAGGALRTLLPADADAIRRIVGVAQERVVMYTRPNLVLGPTQPGAYLSVRTDGKAVRQSPTDTQPVGLVLAARFDPAAAPPIASLLYCRVTAALDPDCRRGTLVQESATSATSVELGPLDVTPGQAALLSASGWSNGSVLVQAGDPSSRVVELHHARAGVPGSLVRLTTQGR